MVDRSAIRRLTVSRLAAAAALIAGLTGIGTTARATEPIPDFVEYTGEGTTEGMGGGRFGPYPATIRIECPGGECFIASAHLVSPQYDWDMTQGRRLELVDGRGEYQMEEWGDICGGIFWAVDGPMTVDAGSDGITIVRNGRGTADDACLGDAAGIVEISFTGTITGTVSAGNACVLDSSCAADAAVAPERADGPGTLSTLPTVADSARPANILWAIGFAVVLVLLIAFPTQLLNTAAEQGADRFSAWWANARPKKRELPAALERLNGWPLAIAGVVVASVISAFVDPRFG